MKVALIDPPREGTKFKALPRLLYWFPSQRIAVLKACTPDWVDLDVFDKSLEGIVYDNYDAVGISVQTSVAPRAYSLADRFRMHGVKVILGGPHVTIMPEEAKAHADAVVRGYGEERWPEALNDLAKGRLKREYEGLFLEKRILPDRHSRYKSLYTIHAVELSRGCPNSCTYCLVPELSKGEVRYYDIDSIVEDILSTKGKHILPPAKNLIVLLDDNLFGNVTRAKELFRRIIDMDIEWVSQAPVTIAEDEELLQLMAKSGCRGLYLGLESVSNNSLMEVNKNPYRKDYIKKIKDHGFMIYIGLMFGFDGDGPEVFENSLKIQDELKVPVLSHIITPYPSTTLYARLVREERMLYQRYPLEWEFPRDWARFDTAHPTFLPAKMSVNQLEEGFDMFKKESSSLFKVVDYAWHSRNKLLSMILCLVDRYQSKR